VAVAVVAAEGPILDRVLDEEHANAAAGLSRAAYGRFDAAQMKTGWGRGHLRRFALTDGATVLASAKQYALAGVLDRQPVRVCGIGSVFAHLPHGSPADAEMLVERLID